MVGNCKSLIFFHIHRPPYPHLCHFCLGRKQLRAKCLNLPPGHHSPSEWIMKGLKDGGGTHAPTRELMYVWIDVCSCTQAWCGALKTGWEDQPDGLAGKGSCHQGWWPEFDPHDPQSEKDPTLTLSTNLYTCAMAHLPPKQISKRNFKIKNNVDWAWRCLPLILVVSRQKQSSLWLSRMASFT